VTNADDIWRELTAGWQPAPSEDKGSSEPPEKSFPELLRAARSLLNEGMGKEESIYPTLALAAEIDVGVSRLADAKRRLVVAYKDDREWEAEAKRFVSEYQSLAPARILDEILVLERLPLSVRIHYHPATAVASRVVITAYQHTILASPKQVEDEYRTKLSDAGISCVEDSKGLVGFEGMAGLLRINIYPTRAARIGDQNRAASSTAFPHPIVVREFYNTLIGTSSRNGFARHLLIRRRGKSPDPKIIILACVAFFLRTYGNIEGRKDVHGVSNRHVLCANQWNTGLSESGDTTDEVRQLWRVVDTVRDRLLADAYSLRSDID
jgi:hypothetical protein